jgi:hypothetical protein
MSTSTDRRLSQDGVFPNGTTAATVVRLVLDYDATARIEDVAGYFDLEPEDVVAALGYYAQRLEQAQQTFDRSER